LKERSVLLIGKNGAGKTTVSLALEILQKIARGTNRVSDLLKPSSRGRPDVPVRLEIQVEISGEIYDYMVAFEFPEGYRELRVLEEKLEVNGRSFTAGSRRRCILPGWAGSRRAVSVSTGIWWPCRSCKSRLRTILCTSSSAISRAY
jgi:energy-coupling factor transporter ATP-binding protein EcfA2